jgi:phage shock protein PspC (stress-responsive transcriptional regulator)
MVAMDEVRVTARARHGRLLGGVCAGLARRWDVAAGGVRLGFVIGALFLGLGILAYLAAWLILPAESEDGVTAGQRGIVLLAQITGALLGLATLAVGGAAATLFGYGWAIVGASCIVLVVTLASWTRHGPGWALLPIGALVLPSVALAVGGVHVEPSTASVTVAPRTEADLRDYTSGLGMLTIDLRRTILPETGTIPLKIDAGVRRTLIALPHDRCVRVRVSQRQPPGLLRVGAALSGLEDLGYPTTVLFGYGEKRLKDAGRPAPTLELDFSSAGGDLVVRDYPDEIDPRIQPDWPGYPVILETRPDTTGLARSETKRMLREWRARRAEQERSKERIDGLMQGPCVQKRKAKAK